MNVSIELLSKLNDFSGKAITLRDLEVWLTPRLPGYLEVPDSAIAHLAGLVELCLAELQTGIRTERSIRILLRRHLRESNVAMVWWPEEPSHVVSTSTSTSVTPVMGLLWQDLSPFLNNELEEVSV